jgi:hypothetical protein
MATQTDRTSYTYNDDGERQGPKYPNIEVRLTGADGNAFAILARVREAMRRGGVPKGEITQFTTAATSGDYSNLLRTCTDWVKVR